MHYIIQFILVSIISVLMKQITFYNFTTSKDIFLSSLQSSGGGVSIASKHLKHQSQNEKRNRKSVGSVEEVRFSNMHKVFSDGSVQTAMILCRLI